MIAELGRPAEKLFQCIIKNGKCSNLEDLLSKCENAAELVNTNFDGLYPIHIISLRSRDQDLERKLRLVIKHGANIYLKGFQGLTVGHYLCYRSNPMPGLRILKDLCLNLKFGTLIDTDGNNLLLALINPTESKCNDGLRLMETTEFLYSEDVDPRAVNKDGMSFWDSVNSKTSRPTVRKYISQDFLSELICNEDAETDQEITEKKVSDTFTTKLSKEVLRSGEEFFNCRETWCPDLQRTALIRLIKEMDLAFSRGDRKLHGADSLYAYLHDSESMIKSNISRWESNLSDISSEIERDEKRNAGRNLPLKLYSLYCICENKIKIWKKYLEHDLWYWVPNGGDPNDSKWSKIKMSSRLESDFSNLSNCDGWFWRNGLPLRSACPTYYTSTDS